MKFPNLFSSLLLACVALSCAIPAHAHAQSEAPRQSGLFESLGKLLQLQPVVGDGETDAKANRSAIVPSPAPGQGRRVALVIGNSDYQHAQNLPKLTNPTNDAEDVAAALRSFGFEVIERHNQTLEAMNAAIAEFGRRIADSDAALFYFAGHGIQVKNQNYLMPINAKLESEAVVPYQGINVNQILDEMDNAKSAANIVMLDACRNNPVTGKFRSGKTRGLASPGAVPKGTVIVYATDPGNVAADGEGRNGLFTSGLLTAFRGEQLSLDDVLTVASAEVERVSQHTQTPYVNGPKTLQRNFHFRPLSNASNSIDSGNSGKAFLPAAMDKPLAQAPAAMAPAHEAPRPAVPVAPPVAPAFVDDPEFALWAEVKQAGAREYYDAYLKQYPKGKYVALVKVELKKIDEKDKQATERMRQQVLRDEQGVWERTKQQDNAGAYAGYLDSYPKGRYATLAQAAKTRLQREAAEREKQEAVRKEREARETEQRLWESTQSDDNEEGYRQFLDRYPQSRYAAQAQARFKQLEAELRPGKVFKDCAECPEMVVISVGSFEMGSNSGDRDEKPVHSVRIGKPFALAKTEVTQGQWRAIMGNNPNHFSSCGDTCPVERVNWDEAQEFVRKFSQKTGKRYRLPSEAEWEYACRAGGTHAYCGNDSIDSVAWYTSNSDSKTRPVAGKQPNAWGLYDMSGNVWEWTEDCWNENYQGAPADGSPWSSGNCGQRVLRGGAWDYVPRYLRSASRIRVVTSGRFDLIGLRPARMLP
jgi:formylglycine-generating enzyme required for sulfatase activity